VLPTTSNQFFPGLRSAVVVVVVVVAVVGSSSFLKIEDQR